MNHNFIQVKEWEQGDVTYIRMYCDCCSTNILQHWIKGKLVLKIIEYSSLSWNEQNRLVGKKPMEFPKREYTHEILF